MEIPLLYSKGIGMIFKCVCTHICYKEYVRAETKFNSFLDSGILLDEYNDLIFLSNMIKNIQMKYHDKVINLITEYKKGSEIDKWKITMLKNISEIVESSKD